jgi:hypothetical protein
MPTKQDGKNIEAPQGVKGFYGNFLPAPFPGGRVFQGLPSKDMDII